MQELRVVVRPTMKGMACMAHLHGGIADFLEKRMGKALINRDTAFRVEDKHTLKQVKGLS